MKTRVRGIGCFGSIVVVFAFIAYAVSVVFSERTLLKLYEANEVVITVHTESYRYPDDASVLWTVSRSGQTIVDGLFLEAYTNPIWPRFKALRSKDGTVIGIIDVDDADRVLALYDVTDGAHWDTSLDEGNNSDVAKVLLSKLKTGVNRPLRL